MRKDLSIYEKALFVEIQSLDNEHGCYASNKYLGEFLGVGERQVRRYIQRLQEKKLIRVTIKDKYDRQIRAAGKFARTPDADLLAPESVVNEESIRKSKKEINEMLRKMGKRYEDFPD